jgi:ribosomal protein S18 acetylase RimI-like enzyme
VHRSAQEIRLVDLVIAPAHRQQGIGTTLMKQLIDNSERARRPLRLHVLRGSRAENWYRRLGFHVITESDVHLELERPLPPPVP